MPIDFSTLMKQMNEHTTNLNRIPPRTYLGLSSIGDECLRKIFYRWRFASYETFPPRLHRLFSRGHQEEPRFIDLLRGAGALVYPIDPVTKKQYKVILLNGHVKGHLDGLIYLNGEWLLLEMKTANNKSFLKYSRTKDLQVANYEYYAQTQIYMKAYRKAKIKRCLWIVVNKDNDNIYGEVITRDSNCTDQIEERLLELCTTKTIPERCSQDPTYYICGWCWYKDLCFEGKKPNRTCRMCQEVELEDKGKWSCSLKKINLTITDQRKGCDKFNLMEG